MSPASLGLTSMQLGSQCLACQIGRFSNNPGQPGLCVVLLCCCVVVLLCCCVVVLLCCCVVVLLCCCVSQHAIQSTHPKGGCSCCNLSIQDNIMEYIQQCSDIDDTDVERHTAMGVHDYVDESVVVDEDEQGESNNTTTTTTTTITITTTTSTTSTTTTTTTTRKVYHYLLLLLFN